MKNYTFDGFDFEVNDDGIIKVTNNSQEIASLWFFKPSTMYAPFSYGGFNSGVWCTTRPNEWLDVNDKGKALIEIHMSDKCILLEYLQEQNEIVDANSPLIKVENFIIQPVKFSFISTAYQTHKYVKQFLESIISLQRKYLQIEILIGIDGCYQTLRHFYELDLPDFVKVYFFGENVGKSPIVNTLSQKASGDYLIFVDSDDIVMNNMIEVAAQNIIDNDLLIFNCLSFEDGTNHMNATNKLNVGGCTCIRKDRFISMNGYHRWRCSMDDEFIRRSRSHKLKIYSPDPATFWYRRHKRGLSNSDTFNTHSSFRGVYRSILTKNTTFNHWPNPKKLQTENCYRIF